ncbi:phage tail protein [Pseudomonas sp. EL_65y_Pfl1_R83]|uniref:phage tail protein n=1 Tax=Pseudomonas sp. EL_65y_Pfl1_R83 TaxID=3088697 RepID=UPI0030D930AF
MVDKNSIFGGMITTLGAAKKTNCDALGVPWEPRYMLIGDANGADPVPSPTQTKLINQVYRAQLNQLRVSPTDANVLIAEVVLPPDVGGWHIRELALEDKDGVFSAVANVPPSYKPLLAQGSGRNQVVRMHIITSGTSNIQLKIDPSVVLATRQYVDEAVNGLLPTNKPAGTYTKVTVNDRGVFVSGSNPTTLAGYGITDTYTKDQITAMIAQASALPVGSMIGFPVNKVAPGFLELDGSVKSAAAYPDLATFLGGVFNKGDEGAGNFRLPESRGEFLRGWDHGRGVDAGRAIGSMQLDSLQGFRMESMRGKASTSWGNDDGGAGDPAWGPPMGSVTPSTRPRNLTGAFVSDGVNGVPRIGSETRSRSLAVMWCIKAWNAPINQGNIDIAALAALAAQATENNQGTAKVATQSQVDLGVDDATIVTPKKLRAGFRVSLGVNGYICFPSWMGGLVWQWGNKAFTSGASSPFAMPFPVEALIAWAVPNSIVGGSPSTVAANVQSLTTNAMILSWTAGGTYNFFWFALGR